LNILLTGGGGYIGSILTPMLLNAGHNVLVIDNFMYNQSALLDCCADAKLEIIRGDARDETLMRKCLSNSIDFIIPLACIVGAPACDKKPIEAKTTNLDAVLMILKIRDLSQKIIYPTTNSGYGIGQDGIYCTEETPLKPISYYGRLKVEAERGVVSSRNAVAFRLATVFGMSPRMRFDLLVNDFVYKALTERSLTLFESHFKRNFIHIRDAAKAFLFAIENFDKMDGNSFNVGLSEANITKKELCEKIKKQIPDFWFAEYTGNDKLSDPDKRNYIVSNEKIEKLGYKAKISIEDGIKEIIKGCQVLSMNQFSNV